jgi:uncharacterized Zn-finger protein
MRRCKPNRCSGSGEQPWDHKLVFRDPVDSSWNPKDKYICNYCGKRVGIYSTGRRDMWPIDSWIKTHYTKPRKE